MPTGRNITITTEEKRIIKPEEFSTLDDVVVTTPEGFFRVEKAPYYKEGEYRQKDSTTQRKKNEIYYRYRGTIEDLKTFGEITKEMEAEYDRVDNDIKEIVMDLKEDPNNQELLLALAYGRQKQKELKEEHGKVMKVRLELKKELEEVKAELVRLKIMRINSK